MKARTPLAPQYRVPDGAWRELGRKAGRSLLLLGLLMVGLAMLAVLLLRALVALLTELLVLTETTVAERLDARPIGLFVGRLMAEDLITHTTQTTMTTTTTGVSL